MDDLLEPSSAPNIPQKEDDEANNSSGDEDGALDWSKLAAINSLNRPVIPKRGEKDFEPRAGGSNLQAHNLERARGAMFGVLKATRSIQRCICMDFNLVG